MRRLFFGMIIVLYVASVCVLPSAQIFGAQTTHPHFDWPDETVAYTFAEQFMHTGSFRRETVAHAAELVRPRATNVIDGLLVPGMFLGAPLLLACSMLLFGVSLSLFLFPLLAGLSLVLLYHILRFFSSRTSAMVGTILLATHPAFWYYAQSSALPNIPLLFFVLVMVYCFCRPVSRYPLRAQLTFFLGGVAWACAVFIRPNEIIWLSILLGSLALSLKEKRLLPFSMLGALIVFVPGALVHVATYGSLLATGYSQLTPLGPVLPSVVGGGTGLLNILHSLFAPVGFSPILILKNLWHALVQIDPLFLLALCALSLWGLWKQPNMFRSYWVGVGASIGVLLLLMYGSWQNADPELRVLNTIGQSQVRYWLPLVVLTVLLLTYLLDRLLETFPRAKYTIIFFLLLHVSWGARLTFFSAEESMLPVWHRVQSYNAAALVVSHQTPTNSVIITERTDKEIFPDRFVTVWIPTAADGIPEGAYRAVLDNAPLFAYGPWDATRAQEIASQFLTRAGRENNGVRLDRIAEPRPGYTLWHIFP